MLTITVKYKNVKAAKKTVMLTMSLGSVSVYLKCECNLEKY